MSTNGLNEQKAEAFAEKMVEVLNDGAIALMASIGHRTGLFDTLATMPPASSDQIAETAGLHERYVREWLGAMVVSEIVDYDSKTETYRLPVEHGASLTRAAAPNNIAAFTQYIGLLGTVEDGIVDSFRNGGGVPYSAFTRFQEVMAEDSGQTVVPALLDSILPLAPGLVEALQRGIDVLDLGCGLGRAVNIMAEAFPNSNFTGYDFSEEGVAAAQAEARQKGLTNVNFAAKDAAKLDESDRYDLITTFDAIHDQAQPATVLENIFKALRADGTYLMQDIAGSSHVHNNVDHPLGPFLYTVSTMHCMTVSLAQDGEGLGTMWGKEKALEMLAEAGFTNVEVNQLPHDDQNFYYVVSK
jgi:2-polyprenyl-3-methyl-5-hydroxy-6-metoxy-1,4-benzoquinol methylase